MKLFKTLAATAAFITCCIGNPLASEANPINPINSEYMDCYTFLRNGALVDQSAGRPIMSARCQDYSDDQYWTVGQYIRSL